MPIRLRVRLLPLWAVSLFVYVHYLCGIYDEGAMYRIESNYLRALAEESSGSDGGSPEILGFCPAASGVAKDNTILSPFFKQARSERDKKWRRYLSDDRVMQRMRECKQINSSSSSPVVRLAFSITVHEHLGLLETLLGLLSRPGHSICLHVDAKASRFIHDYVAAIVDCHRRRHTTTTFFLVPDPDKVYWGHVSLLQSDLKCLSILLQSEIKWDYFLNLASSVLPSHPMEKVEEMIAGLKGRSLMTGVPMGEDFSDRTHYVHKLQQQDRYSGYYSLHRTNRKLKPPPYNLTIYKGYREVILNRTFAQFVDSHWVSRSLLQWFKFAGIPDESFFNTLSWVSVDERTGEVSQSPGVFPEPFLIRFTQWVFEGLECRGPFVRDICQFTMDDLTMLVNVSRKSIFINKFNMEHDAMAVACWAERVGGGARHYN